MRVLQSENLHNALNISRFARDINIRNNAKL